MNHFCHPPNIVTLKSTYTDEHTMHRAQQGWRHYGELFGMTIARGHYNDHILVVVTRTIVEVLHVCWLFFNPSFNTSLVNVSLV